MGQKFCAKCASFKQTGTDDPITLADPVFFTFYDLDAGSNLANYECIAVSDATQAIVGTGSTLSQIADVHPTRSVSRTRYCAAEQGTGSDNPSSSSELTDAQKAWSVMYEFRNVDSFEMTTYLFC